MWKASDWICGQQADSRLPWRWKGTCTLGVILPSFFTLLWFKGDPLEKAPLDKTRSNNKTNLNPLRGSCQWSENEWSAEKIINFYNPTT